MKIKFRRRIRISERDRKFAGEVPSGHVGPQVVLHILPYIQEVGHPNQGREIGITPGNGIREERLPTYPLIFLLVVGSQQLTTNLNNLISETIESYKENAIESASNLTEVG